MAFSLSPGVSVVEQDLSLSTQTIVDTAGAFVGNFKWGVVEDRVLIAGGESQLVTQFGKPDNDTFQSFYGAANFMSYNLPLYLVRIVGDAARNAVPSGEIAVLVKNKSAHEQAVLTGLSLIAKYPGTVANGLEIHTAHGTGYDSWEYADEFEYPTAADEFHLVVVDATGAFSGTPGTVLERFDFLQETVGSTKPDGTNAYYADVINEQSVYLWIGDTSVPATTSNGTRSITLAGGVDDHANAVNNYQAGWDLFASTDDVAVTYLITGNATASDAGYVVDLAAARQDCMAFVSPERSDVVNAISPMDNVLDFRSTGFNRNTSYGFLDDNWKLQYDKYNNVNRWLPCNPDTAALWGRASVNGNPWDAGAGYARGQVKNVIRLAWNSRQAHRDQLFKKQVNSIVSFPGEGTILYGDKTLLTRPSVFSGANVRFLFIVLRKSIAESAKYQLFELNTVATRSRFANQVTQFLRNIQSKGGIIRFEVIADERNNTEQVINEGRFVAQMVVQPAQTIRNVVLEFTAVNSSTQFDEIEQALGA